MNGIKIKKQAKSTLSHGKSLPNRPPLSHYYAFCVRVNEFY
ncbi:hypothetical protein FORC065_3428 [Yersinia enterocolitica]|nr:hypothetical protein FORC065_3428 [Yersinia enterocolitica]